MIKLKTLLLEQVTWTRLLKYLDDIIVDTKATSKNKKISQAEREAAEALAKQKVDDVINGLSSTNAIEVLETLKSSKLYDDLTDAIKNCAKNPTVNKPNNIITNLLTFFKQHELSDRDALAATKRVLNTFAKEKGHGSWKSMSSQLSKGTIQPTKLAQFKKTNPKLYKTTARTAAAGGVAGAGYEGYQVYDYVTDTTRKQEKSENSNSEVLNTVTPGAYDLSKSLFDNIKTCKIYNASKNQTKIKPGDEKLEWSNAIFDRATLVMYGDGETKTNHGQVMFIPMIGTLTVTVNTPIGGITVGEHKFVCDNWVGEDATKSSGVMGVSSVIENMNIYLNDELLYVGTVNDKLQPNGLGKVGRITDMWVNGMCPAYGNMTPKEMREKFNF